MSLRVGVFDILLRCQFLGIAMVWLLPQLLVLSRGDRFAISLQSRSARVMRPLIINGDFEADGRFLEIVDVLLDWIARCPCCIGILGYDTQLFLLEWSDVIFLRWGLSCERLWNDSSSFDKLVPMAARVGRCFRLEMRGRRILSPLDRALISHFALLL